MAITNELLTQAVNIIADIQGIEIDPDTLVDDVVSIAYVFDSEILFKTAITQIQHSIHLILRERSIGQALVGNLSGWRSFHFQSQRVNKHRMLQNDFQLNQLPLDLILNSAHRWVKGHF